MDMIMQAAYDSVETFFETVRLLHCKFVYMDERTDRRRMDRQTDRQVKVNLSLTLKPKCS